MKKAFTLFLCLLLAVLLCLSPVLLREGIYKTVYTQQAAQKAKQYTGKLTLWHIVSFKTGGESGVSFLRSRIRTFERSNPYVFIDLEAYSPNEAAARLAAGEAPDILSFPLGFIHNPAQLTPLAPITTLCKPFRQVGTYEDTLYAYPYMADFYTLCIDADAMFYQDITLPMDTLLDTLALETLSDDLNTAKPIRLAMGDTCTPISKATWLYPYGSTLSAAALTYWQTISSAQAQQFWQKEAALLLCPAAEMQRAQVQGLADTLSLQSYAFSNFTDLCQLIGVSSNTSGAKQAMCCKFAASLLSDTAQKALTGLRMLPVTRQNSIYEDVPFYAQVYEHFYKNGILPNNFSYAQYNTSFSLIQPDVVEMLQKELLLQN